ncbi:MAG: dethiobiotin synthase, partial [Gammaproteobacteria bacterium]|nr:dethiobiotin synthase [Gammaproteobacteria bacterium]
TRVIPRKPVESGCTHRDGQLIPEDALALHQASAYAGDLSEVCAYRFEAAISPARAAHLNNLSLSIQQLASHCLTVPGHQDDFLLVEGAGGFYSPLTSDGLNADLAQQLDLPVLLIADNKLGCINQVLLSVAAIENRQLKPAAIILNQQADETAANAMDNLADLKSLLSYPVLSCAANTTPGTGFLQQLGAILI